MIFLKRSIEYAVFSAAILLAFLLVFEKYLVVPVFVKWIGHWHPLVLHFPIVLILVTIIQYWRKDAYINWYISITTFFTFITAITGFLLSLESGSKGSLILSHQWLGVGVSYLMAIWFWLSEGNILRGISPVFLQGVLIILIVFTGHVGGMVTHGEDFLAFGLGKDPVQKNIPENPIISQHIIQPILDEKCVSCHNPNKSKGELVLSDFASMLKGGKSGKGLDLQDPSNSLLLGRISLPLEDEAHMPPKDERQLTDDEMILLTEWIISGAGQSETFRDLDINSQSFALVKKLIEESGQNKWNELPDVSEEKLMDLSSNYVRINRLFHQSNALQVIIFPHKAYSSTIIKDLKSIAENIVELNLSGLSIGDEELDFVGALLNLEKLNISNTVANDQNIRPMAKLKKLRELRIYNTNVTDEAFNVLRDLPALSHLFVYNTGMTEEGLNLFRNIKEDIYVIKTSEEAAEFKSVLPTPQIEPNKYFFRKPFKIKLNHPLGDINLFYTMDGSTPVETSDLAQDSLIISESVQLKFYAAKDGWEPSPVDSIRILKTGIKPDHFSLKHPPDSKFVGRGEKLLFDLEKGIEVFGDSAWMAFREESFTLSCEWQEEINIGSVVLSSIVHTDPYLFPPESITVRGGRDRTRMKILGRVVPEKLEARTGGYFEFYECRFDPVTIHFIEIEVQPLQRIPMWHQGKGEKGWFFIDEVVFQGGFPES
jgi:hypothetical protein